MKLTQKLMDQGVAELTGRDADLGRAVSEVGPPPFWKDRPGFATLVRFVTEQSVSLAAAAAVFGRLQAAVEVTPAGLAVLSADDFRSFGYSYAKAATLAGLAAAVNDGLSIDGLATLPDEVVSERLTSLRGIGPWTADNYLLFALRRSDAFPVGDIALLQAWADLKEVAERPSQKELLAVAEEWRPWRAVAARILWHFYLTRRGRS